jgi:hypothetical protein
VINFSWEVNEVVPLYFLEIFIQILQFLRKDHINFVYLLILTLRTKVDLWKVTNKKKGKKVSKTQMLYAHDFTENPEIRLRLPAGAVNVLNLSLTWPTRSFDGTK